MKILPYDPKSSLTKNFPDNSRLGEYVKTVDPNNLAHLEHGIVILGLADDRGIRNVGGRPGAAEGPTALRQKLYKFTTGKPLLPIYDMGDFLPVGPLEETLQSAALLCKRIHETGHTPLVIGGGHDLGFPPALGLLHARNGNRVTVFNIDAHLDVRPTTQGITSGSPWFLLREHPLFSKSQSRLEEFGIQPHCNAAVLVEYAKRHRFGLHWLEDLQKQGVQTSFQKLLKKNSSSSILVSFDIDSVQWSDAPGCSAPQTLGFTAAEAIEMSYLAGTEQKVESFGLFELSPALDTDGRTATLAAHCLHAFLRGRGYWGKGNREFGIAAKGAKIKSNAKRKKATEVRRR